jgi:hypothetical protein
MKKRRMVFENEKKNAPSIYINEMYLFILSENGFKKEANPFDVRI